MLLPDALYKQTAEELKLPVELIKRVNNFFWREGVKSAMSNIDHSSIFIKNFGTIVISKFKLNKEILYMIKKIRRIQSSPKYSEKKRDFIIEGYKKHLRRMLRMRNEIIKTNYFENGYTY